MRMESECSAVEERGRERQRRREGEYIRRGAGDSCSDMQLGNGVLERGSLALPKRAIADERTSAQLNDEDQEVYI